VGGVDGSLHLTVPSMNRLNQTEPATFSILPCWPSLGILISLYFKTCCVIKLQDHNKNIQKGNVFFLPMSWIIKEN
jgi:hypothetical protein